MLRAARAVVPAGTAVQAASIGATHAYLSRDEERHVVGAVPTRRREFAAGRAAARIALAQIGVDAPSIPAGPAREPVWPEGVVGSLSHDGDYCVAAVHWSSAVRAIGIDIAAAAPLDAALIDRICTHGERRELARMSADVWACDPYKIVFSAKEAVYKCLFALSGSVFGFRAVHMRLDPARGRASVRALHSAHGARAARLECRFRVTPGYVVSGAWIEASAASRAA